MRRWRANQGVTMSNYPTRRDFLKVSSLGAATLASMSALTGQSPRTDASSARGKDISVWVTDEKQRLAQLPHLSWQPAPIQAVQETVILTPKRAFQDILGFGAAFTDAACYTLNRLPLPTRAELFHQLFDPSEMGLNVCRTCIGSSDYATKAYSYCD